MNPYGIELYRMHLEYPAKKEDFIRSSWYFIENVGMMTYIDMMATIPHTRIIRSNVLVKGSFVVPNQFPKKYKIRYMMDHLDYTNKSIAEFLSITSDTASKYRREIKKKAPLSKGQQSKGNGNIN